MFIILCRLFLFMSIVVYGQNFTPGLRIGQAAVLVKDKIYYIGGLNFYNESESTSDIFYFNLTGVYWTNFTYQGIIPLTVGHIADIGGINKDSIFIIGGVHFDKSNTNYIYRFDTKINAVDIPVIQGKAPTMRTGMNSISYEGKIFMFGGQIGFDKNAVFLNNIFDILDTVNLNWQVGSLVNSPVTRSQYTATLVNGIIYYIGGISGLYNFSPMTEIYQYDIIENKWSLKTATAVDSETIPGSRIGHSAGLVLDSKIVVYGGSYYNSDTPYGVPPKNTIVMLDTNTLVWSVPKLNDINVPKLAYHSAIVFNDIMTIVFGNYTDKPNNYDQTNKSIVSFFFNPDIVKWDILHIYTFAYINITKSKSQVPVLPGSSITDPSQTPPNKMVIVCASIGSVVVVLAILVVLTLVYKRMKKIKNEDKDPKDPTNDDPSFL